MKFLNLFSFGKRRKQQKREQLIVSGSRIKTAYKRRGLKALIPAMSDEERKEKRKISARKYREKKKEERNRIILEQTGMTYEENKRIDAVVRGTTNFTVSNSVKNIIQQIEEDKRAEVVQDVNLDLLEKEQQYDRAQFVKSEIEKNIYPDFMTQYNNVHEESMVTALQSGKDFVFPEFNQVTVDVFKEQLERAKNSGYKGAIYLSEFFNRVGGLYGVDILADVINRASQNGLQISWEVMYDEQQAKLSAEAFMAYLWDIEAVGKVEYEEAMYMLGQTEDIDWATYDTDEVYGRK